MADKTWTLYCHKNKENGKRYYGITCQLPEQRWMNGYGYAAHLPIGRAIRKHGWSNFEHIIVMDNLLFTFPSARHAAETLGVNYRNISLAIHGRRKHCGGYKWSFA